MIIPDSFDSLEDYPNAAGGTADGKYVIRTKEGKQVESVGPDIEYANWFRTPPLNEQTIERLRGLQLVTESHDQGFCDDAAAGIWTWFELAIMESTDADEPRTKDGIELSWTSHKNVLAVEEPAWLKGSLFSKDHDIFRLVEENNVIVVRICSRFEGWSLTANRGFLVVDLGAPVKRDPISYGSVALNLFSTQEAFNQVNEALFPDRELVTLPDSLLKAENLSTASEEKRPLRVLSMDGGGVRGRSSLMVLKRVMETAFPGEKKKPCEVFDMIGGTSTGGLIAIMLGRLEMDVDTCIAKYDEFMGKIFPEGGVFTRYNFPFGSILDWITGKVTDPIRVGAGFAMRDHTVLEGIIKDLVKEQLGVTDPDNVLLFDPENPNPRCKVFVTAAKTQDISNNAPVLFRSYETSYAKPELPSIKLWEAARATSAAPVYFQPLTVDYKVGEETKKVTFVDGGVQANNPIGWLWSEVIQKFGPVRPTDCFLSIGTGLPLGVSIPHLNALNAGSFLEGLTGILTNTESANILFRVLINLLSPLPGKPKYWRFEFGDGLPDWFVDEEGVGRWRLLAKRREQDLGKMDDIKMVPLMTKLTEEYMDQEGFTKLSQDCGKALRDV